MLAEKVTSVSLSTGTLVHRHMSDHLLLCVSKGALDGGLDIPHGDKRFVGYDTEAKKLDPEQLKRYIMGGHVSLCCCIGF